MTHDRNEQAMPCVPALLEGWMRLFVNRSQPYAVQQADGTYRWRYEPFDLTVLAGHLNGELTVALSSTDARGRCKWVCLDADAPGSLPRLAALRARLADDRLPGVVEASRRGGHLWLFFDVPVPAIAARYVVGEALARRGHDDALALELYPDTSEAGALGHAVRLPLGLHRCTGLRYPVLDEAGRPMTGIVAHLVHYQWQRFLSASGGPASIPTPRALTPTGPPGADVLPMPSQVGVRGVGTRSAVIHWVDAHVSPLDVLEELAPGCALRRSGQGSIGWCPFHEDRAPDMEGRPGTPSFYVVRNARYGWSWRCLLTHCAHHDGPMRHTFRLFQELLRLDTPAAIRAAAARWPEAADGAYPGAKGDHDADDSPTD